jgi:hypothetical protein
MAVALGLRVAPTQVTFAVASQEGDTRLVRTVDVVKVPRALQLPDQLRFVRTTVLDVIEEFGVTRAGLKLVENTARGRHEFRFNLEGVMQELLASSPIECFFTGRIDRLTALLGETSRPRVKRYINGEEPYTHIATWEEYSTPVERESVLAALAALSERL